jgi:hypothetical protein
MMNMNEIKVLYDELLDSEGDEKTALEARRDALTPAEYHLWKLVSQKALEDDHKKVCDDRIRLLNERTHLIAKVKDFEKANQELMEVNEDLTQGVIPEEAGVITRMGVEFDLRESSLKQDKIRLTKERDDARIRDYHTRQRLLKDKIRLTKERDDARRGLLEDKIRLTRERDDARRSDLGAQLALTECAATARRLQEQIECHQMSADDSLFTRDALMFKCEYIEKHPEEWKEQDTPTFIAELLTFYSDYPVDPFTPDRRQILKGIFNLQNTEADPTEWRFWS